MGPPVSGSLPGKELPRGLGSVPRAAWGPRSCWRQWDAPARGWAVLSASILLLLGLGALSPVGLIRAPLLSSPVPKAQSDQCVPDRDPRWEVLDVTKKAVASPRIISLAKPKVRKDLNEGYDPYRISPASLVAQASPRLYELAVPKSITKRV